MKKEHRRFIRNVKAIPGTFHHALVIVNIDKKKIRKVVKKACAEIGTSYAVFILRKMKEVYHAKEGKLYMFFVDLEKGFDSVPLNVF